MKEAQLNRRLSIIVSSCDAFRDCWEPLVDSFRKYWPDCPYDRYLITNEHTFHGDGFGFEIVQVGEDKGWASNMQTALDKIGCHTPYVMYFQDDFWLKSSVFTEFIERELNYCEKRQLDYLRLTCPWMDKYKIDGTHALSPIGKEPYALCLSASIWRWKSFSKLLVPGWTGWDFEAKITTLGGQSYRAEVLLEHVSRRFFPIIGLAGGAVRKGRWTREAKRYLKDHGFEVLLPLRETEGLFYTFCLFMLRSGKIFRWVFDPVVIWMHRHHFNF